MTVNTVRHVESTLLDLHDVAARLGCSVITARRYAAARRFPVVRLPGGEYRVRLGDLERALAGWETR
jgi:predicted site-specific integrase-resolvase